MGAGSGERETPCVLVKLELLSGTEIKILRVVGAIKAKLAKSKCCLKNNT